MLGTFGISAPLERWSEAEIALVRGHVDWYKQRVQPLIQHGDEWFLTDPPPHDGNGEWASILYTSKDSATGVLFAFRLAHGDPSRDLALPGLDPDATYVVSSFEGSTEQRTGRALAAGFTVNAEEPFRSVLISLERR